MLLTVLCTAERGDFLLFAAVWLTGAAAATLPPVLQLWRRRLCVAALGTCLLLLLLQPLALSILEPRPWLNAGMQLLAGLAYAVLLFDLRWLLLAWALARPLEQAARFRALIQGVGRRVWPGGPAP